MATTDSATTLQTQSEFDAYGVATFSSGTTPGATKFQFGGKVGYVSDDHSGLDLLGRRYYIPALGRFLTQDPSGQSAGLNLYVYGDDNPLGHLDPSGLDATTLSLWSFIASSPYGKVFPSEDTAATYVLKYFFPLSDKINREIGGWIQRTRYGIQMYPFVETGGPGQTNVPGQPFVGPLAIWHTHPGAYGDPDPRHPGRRFGSPDVFSVRQFGNEGDLYTYDFFKADGYIMSRNLIRKFTYSTGKDDILEQFKN